METYSLKVANPHPLRPQTLALGRSERSVEQHPIELRDFVDVEKARRLIAEGKPLIHEDPLVDYTTLITAWEMFLNNLLGDCTVASVAHGRMIFSALLGEEVRITYADIERMYEASGWRRNKAGSDQGWTLVAAAEYAQSIGLLGTKDKPAPDIDAFAGVSVEDQDAQQVAMELFGGLSTGVEVPESAMRQFQEGKPWTVVKGSPIEGGHAIWKALSRLRKVAKFITWGAAQEAVEAWEREYVDEYLAFVPHAWETKLPEPVLALGIVDFSKLKSLVTQYAA